MASTQVTRAAAQLHEAALDVARVAALRSAQPEEPETGPQVPQQLGLAQDEDDTVPAEAGTTGPEKDPDAGHAGDVAIAPDRGKGGRSWLNGC
jgi:hypothetical protein